MSEQASERNAWWMSTRRSWRMRSLRKRCVPAYLEEQWQDLIGAAIVHHRLLCMGASVQVLGVEESGVHLADEEVPQVLKPCTRGG
jgi:hypothetical protein